MSHTKRIYNNPNIKKAQRYNVDDSKPHLIIGIPLTKRSWLCMGKCPMCRDKNKEPRLIRKRLRELIQEEIAGAGYKTLMALVNKGFLITRFFGDRDYYQLREV